MRWKRSELGEQREGRYNSGSGIAYPAPLFGPPAKPKLMRILVFVLDTAESVRRRSRVERPNPFEARRILGFGKGIENTVSLAMEMDRKIQCNLAHELCTLSQFHVRIIIATSISRGIRRQCRLPFGCQIPSAQASRWVSPRSRTKQIGQFPCPAILLTHSFISFGSPSLSLACAGGSV